MYTRKVTSQYKDRVFPPQKKAPPHPHETARMRAMAWSRPSCPMRRLFRHVPCRARFKNDTRKGDTGGFLGWCYCQGSKTESFEGCKNFMKSEWTLAKVCHLSIRLAGINNIQWIFPGPLNGSEVVELQKCGLASRKLHVFPIRATWKQNLKPREREREREKKKKKAQKCATDSFFKTYFNYSGRCHECI